MTSKKAVVEKFLHCFQKGQYEELICLVDPKFRWEIKGIPAWKGTYSLNRIKGLYKKLQTKTEAKLHSKVHDLILADKCAIVHLTQSVRQYGERHTIDAIWIMYLNRSGNKILRIQSFLMASPEIQSYAEMLKAA